MAVAPESLTEVTEIPEQGRSREDVMATLRTYKQGDCDYKSGHVWAYTYDPGKETAEVSKAAYMEFLSESALDPTAFPSVVRLEREVVRTIANLLRGDENVVGNMTSGGTESILLALKTARDWAKAEKGITEPEVVLPQTVHPAFFKACAYFNIKPVVTPFDPESFEADVDAMRAAITKNTCMLVGSACGYAQGVIDPIEKIGPLAKEHGLLCHVDGCVGGIHFSIMRRMGHDLPAFDFSVPGVTSISADMHKYGYAPKNASVVVYRDKSIRKYQIFSCSKSATYALINPTIMSTKSGGPMAGSWATLNFLGEEGYRDIITRAMDATQRLIDGINAIPELYVLGKPQMCMFSFASDEINVFQLMDEMKTRGWTLQPQFSTEISPPNLHITVNQNAVEGVDEFLAELVKGVEAVRAQDKMDFALVREQVRGMLDGMGIEEAASQLQAMAGISGSDLPDEGMAMLNTVLDAVPNDIREALLVEFFNELYC